MGARVSDYPVTDMERIEWWQENAVDLGQGYYAKVTEGGNALVLAHPGREARGTGGICWHRLTLGGGGWKLLNLHPITIEPSVESKPCGFHGFIREGRWVPST